MSDFATRLAAALGQSYRVERELGGGGMSRVFLADEVDLGRRVVIKVLPPEMAAGVNAERFRREIQLAAKLQHPHIVPLLAAGAAGELLYYVMPFIEGESLRAKLARQGELPIPDALRVLRDVVDAVAYAHRHGVVHRDIKPDNVLLSENHALVADFGVAKAVTESAGTHSLTSVGVALGTPAYMAPEQATADPQMDHRADLYAIGALAYEMLAGRPPFVGSNAQSILAAHIADPPDPVTRHRAAVPASLATMVMRCLEKKPADRWQRAEDLLNQLEGILTPTGGTAPVPAPRVSGSLEQLAGHGHPVRVAALFGVGAAVVLALVYILMNQLGLPDWVFVAAVALLAMGLPIMVVTGLHERRRASQAAVGTHAKTPAGLRRHFTWRKAVLGGGVAFTGLGVVTAAYMAMRVLGIGPVGTLVAAGALDPNDRLILADFVNRSADSALGPSVTEALRVDLSQARVVRLMDRAAVTDALRRMERPAGTVLDLATASEIAEREGIKAVVSGEIGPVGRGFVLSASLLSAESRQEMVAVRETAADDGEIIAAIDRLSSRLRERIGESLKTIRSKPQLSQVTTASLAALKKYSEGTRANNVGDFDRAVALAGEAIALDTAFASAYRLLSVGLSNVGAEQSRISAAASQAFQHRNRLPDVERHLTGAFYYTVAKPDADSLTAEYLSVLQLEPTHRAALNNLALRFNLARDWKRAEEHARRGMEVARTAQLYYNLAYALVGQGRIAAAESTGAQMAVEQPNAPSVPWFRGHLAGARRDFAAAAVEFRALLDQFGSARTSRVRAIEALAAIDETHGRLGSATQRLTDLAESHAKEGQRRDYLLNAVALGWLDLRYRAQPSAVIRRLDAALERYPLVTLPPEDRPFLELAELYAAAARPERARQFLAEFEGVTSAALKGDTPLRHSAAGAIALAEQRYPEAIAAYQARVAGSQVRFDESCNPCGMFELAQAYDLAGRPDSAIAAFERALETPSYVRLFNESGHLAHAYRRLGELYELRRDSAKAADYYHRFVELWKDADPELQTGVRDARRRLGRLVGELGPR